MQGESTPRSEIVAEQILYYRRRAAEYDETSDWRIDPYDDDWNTLNAALASFRPGNPTLEIACGTGQWTRELLRYSNDITALDSSPEMIALNQEKLASSAVRYVETNVFEWEPDRAYETVFFANWLSHVLPGDLERFWSLVRAALAPGGRVFFVDEAQDLTWRREEWTDVAHVATRRLRDGSAHRAVKIFWEAEELERRLRDLGWDMVVRATPALLYGHGRPAAS